MAFGKDNERVASPPDRLKDRLQNRVGVFLDGRPNELALFVVNRNNSPDRRAVIDEAFQFCLLKTSAAIERHAGFAGSEGTWA